MFDDKQQIMERVRSLPKGTHSSSGRYWCVTCKMLFSLDEPVCPYMPKMCINTPIPVELMPVESAITLEKFGLFYPKVPQKLMAHLADTDEPVDAAALVDAYLSFLADWGIRPAEEPLQTLKSFIILLSGCETAQRVNDEAITFVVTDLERIWREDRLLPLLEATLPLLAAEVGLTQPIRLDSMVLMGEKPSGRYFCPMCRKFFEFSTQTGHGHLPADGAEVHGHADGHRGHQVQAGRPGARLRGDAGLLREADRGVAAARRRTRSPRGRAA